MKITRTKDWFEKSADIEGECEVGAIGPAMSAPQPPENAVILGYGGTFKVPESSWLTGWSRTEAKSSKWRSETGRLYWNDPKRLYAAPADSEVVRMNATLSCRCGWKGLPQQTVNLTGQLKGLCPSCYKGGYAIIPRLNQPVASEATAEPFCTCEKPTGDGYRCQNCYMPSSTRESTAGEVPSDLPPLPSLPDGFDSWVFQGTEGKAPKGIPHCSLLCVNGDGPLKWSVSEEEVTHYSTEWCLASKSTSEVRNAPAEAGSETPTIEELLARDGFLGYGVPRSEIVELAKTLQTENTAIKTELAEVRREGKIIRELLRAYRLKRANDGLNGRRWNAGEHLEAEQEVAELEAAINRATLRNLQPEEGR